MSLLPLLGVVLLSAPPDTPRRPVVSVHHDQKVSEDYRWLENWDDAEVKTWSKAQNAHARAYLDKLPGVAALRKRTSALMRAKTKTWYAVGFSAGKTVALAYAPPLQQSFLVVMGSPDNPEAGRVLVDPNELDATGGTHLDWYIPSPDGRLVAVSLSKGGTESGDVHVFDMATGKATGTVIPRVHGGTAGGDVAWDANGKGFFYTRYPRGTERKPEDMSSYMQLYHHTLGQDTSADRYEMGKELPRIAEIQLMAHHASGRLLATVQKGDGGEFSHYLREKDGSWRQLSRFGDKILQLAFGPKNDLYVLSRQGAPRGQVLHAPIDAEDLSKARVLVPEGADTIVEDFWSPPTVLPLATRLLVTYQLGGPSEVRIFDLDGKPQPKPKLLDVSAVSDLVKVEGDVVLLRNGSFLAPPAWYRLDAGSGAVTRTGLVTTTPVNNDDIEVIRDVVESKDGTRVPVNILRKKGLTLDGSHTCLVTGYGGFAVSIAPRFRVTDRVLFDYNIVKITANLRGGGEFGEQWHRDGALTHKQNVFDDFAAAVQYASKAGYCKPERVGIVGGSNGGLLMGATVTQHPRLAAAVVSFVGIYDMLRVELSSNGAFNIPEYGTAKNPEHFKAMHAYSPYHNVKDGTAYPPILFLTGENDPRVDPMQSRKMTARLQAAQKGKAPILLRTSADSGHGGDTKLDERIEQTVDMFAFLFTNLGVKPR